MEADKASATSQGVAGLRAAHQLLDSEPLILRDPIILRLLGPERTSRIQTHPDHYMHPGLMHLRAHVVLRSRYAEDKLKEAYARGIRQYLLLGAGLDTFSWRQPPGLEDLKIFEVDHPATQAQKRAAFARTGIETPPNLHFVPVNFETTSLIDALAQTDFDRSSPAFISWLGVMVYLSMEAIDEVFGFVAALPTDSRIVFTFTQDRGPSELAAIAASKGEPWRTFFSPDQLVAKLGTFGFSSIHILEPEESYRLYFAGRTDGLPCPKHSSICMAIK